MWQSSVCGVFKLEWRLLRVMKMWGVPVPPKALQWRREEGRSAVMTFTNFTQITADQNGRREDPLVPFWQYCVESRVRVYYCIEGTHWFFGIYTCYIQYTCTKKNTPPQLKFKRVNPTWDAPLSKPYNSYTSLPSHSANHQALPHSKQNHTSDT